MIASPFAHPWMLAAGVAVLLPIIIEWLFRRRRRQVELPTLRFLLRNKEQKKVNRQDRILLILRMLGVAFLVLAVARPLLRHGLRDGSNRRHVVVVLDATATMNQQVGVTTAFSMAQKKASALVRAVPPGTLVSVVTLGDKAQTLLDREPDAQTAAARIDSLRAGSGADPMDAALQAARDLLARAPGETPEICIFSDFQKQTWTGGGAAGRIGQQLAEFSKRGETFLIDVGGKPLFNYMLTDLRPQEWLMSVGMPVRFNAAVSAWNPPKDASAKVTFLVNGVKKEVREIRPGEQPVSLTFEHRFTQPGEYLVEAVLEGDEYRNDNHRYCLCTVPETAQVLVLDESAPASADTAAGPSTDAECDSAYFSRALSPPTHPGAERVSRFSVKVVQPAQLDYENIEKYAAVVLAGVSVLGESAAAKLESYASGGGAVWLFLGPRVDLYQYNKLLFKEGNGLLPCKLSAAAASHAIKGASPFLRFGESTHPALAMLSGAGSDDAPFLRYMDLDVSSGSRIVMALSNGAPIVVEKSLGRGKVLLADFTAGVDWSLLPATAEFPVLVQELMRYLIGNRDAGVNLTVGDRFEQPVFVSAQHLLVKYPDGHKVRLTPHERADRKNAWVLDLDDTREQGLYEVVDAPPEIVPRLRFVVNPRPGNGDLSRFEQDDFADAVGHGGWRWLGPEAPFDELVSSRLETTELAPMVLWVLAGMLVVESGMAMYFGRRRGGVGA